MNIHRFGKWVRQVKNTFPWLDTVSPNNSSKMMPPSVSAKTFFENIRILRYYELLFQVFLTETLFSWGQEVSVTLLVRGWRAYLVISRFMKFTIFSFSSEHVHWKSGWHHFAWIIGRYWMRTRESVLYVSNWVAKAMGMHKSQYKKSIIFRSP